MRSRLSIPRRVFLGFALVLILSSLVSVASVVQHQRTEATLSLLHEGYLPLSLQVSECRATQSVFINLLERMPAERNSWATRNWLNTNRRKRPELLDQALTRIAKVEALAPPPAERRTLADLRRDLRRVQRAVRKGEERYGELYRALDEGDQSTAERVLADLRVRERTVDGRLRAAWNTILSRIEAVSAQAAQQQEQSIVVLVVIGLMALLVGVAVTIWSQRMLSPLPRLQQRVEAVARGDLARRFEPAADDEIGRLAQEFERMVDALAARDQRLREAAENQLRLQQMQSQILSDLSAAVLVIEGDGRLLIQNPAAELLFGVVGSGSEAELSVVGLLQRLPGLQEAVARVSVAGGTCLLSEERLTGDREGQPERLLNVFVSPFGAEVGALAQRQVLIVAEDVTESVRTKARLIQTERLAAVGRMAAHVTHEVRNPLSSIGLNVELLEEELVDSGSEARELVVAIQREIERLRALTEEYLRVARLPTPQLTPEDMGDVVRDTVEFMRRELRTGGVEVRVELAAAPQVALDEGQFRQVLINLMRNARDAMADGGVLTLRVCQVRGGVELQVADTGVGMDAEQRARIFDLFYTTKKLGTGLGLPLSQQIVLAHGGSIVCQSAQGSGTLFRLWFPAATADMLVAVVEPPEAGRWADAEHLQEGSRDE